MLLYLIHKFILYFNIFIVVYVLMLSLVNITQMLVAMMFSLMYIKKARFSDVKLYQESYNMVPISILVPAHNEEKVIVSSIKSLLALEYSNYEIIVINDGSGDRTFRNVINAFGLRRIAFPVKAKIKTKALKGVYHNPAYPNLLLVDKENGGKADALNAGINISRYPYFVSLDADSLLNSNALVRIALTFMEYKYTVAVGGIIRVANGSEVKDGRVVKLGLPKKRLAVFQIVEYLRAFLVGRVGWSIANSVLIISGAFGAFLKDAVIQVGGYTTDTIGEDMDIIVKLHKYMREKKYKYRIASLPDPICWTQVPESFRDLYSQRRRWQIGLMDTIKRHKEMMLNPRYGVCGMLTMPFFFMFELLAPVVEILGLIVVPLSYFFGVLSLRFFITYFLVATMFGIMLSVGALVIEEFTFNKYVKIGEFLRLCLCAVLENLSYRQMTVIFRLAGILGFNKYKSSWGKIKRVDFTDLTREYT